MTTEQLNQLTKDIARVMQRHGIDTTANEDHNYIRHGVVDMLQEWFEVEVPEDYYAVHTKWWEL